MISLSLAKLFEPSTVCNEVNVVEARQRFEPPTRWIWQRREFPTRGLLEMIEIQGEKISIQLVCPTHAPNGIDDSMVGERCP